jgi:hypothetical protein
MRRHRLEALEGDSAYLEAAIRDRRVVSTRRDCKDCAISFLTWVIDPRCP